MMEAGIVSKRLLGATADLVVSGKVTHVETITQILYVMARLKYNPDGGAD